MNIKLWNAVTNNQQKFFTTIALIACAFLALAFACLSGYTGKTVRLHVHLPVFCLSGKTEYISLLDNQSCINLFNLAQAHDRNGQTDLGTIDIKEGIKSPGFKDLPDKLRATLIELNDCREAMDSHDYFSELVCHSRIGYWNANQMPLRVYVPDLTQNDGFASFDRQEIEKCLRQWCSIIPERLSFQMVDRPEGAQIVFFQKSYPVDISFSRSVLAHTIPLPAGPENWSVFPAGKAIIQPLRLYPDIKDHSDSRAALRHTVLLHEIGHSLGIIGHSSSAADLMFYSGTAEISERDRATIRAIYAPGSLRRRAENALRTRAAAGDMYALVQLATELSESGTASQSRLKEIYDITRRAAAEGSSRARLMLGWMYHDGNGVRRDLRLAGKYFHESATQGNPAALLPLSTVYEKGEGSPANLELAEKYLKLALRVDAVRAPVAYGNFLSYQYGDKSNLELAARFYKNACQNNQPEAMSRLALLYAHGEGVNKDLTESKKWHNEAREQILCMKAEDAPGYFTRACAFNEIGEPQRALHDFSEALRLKPDSLNSYLGRGAAYGCAGDNEAACRDLTKALEIDPDCLQAYLGRAYVNLGLGRAASALKDVNSVLSRSQNPDSDRLYALIVGSLACRFLHNESDAARMLDEALAASQPQIWPGPIIRFLDHKIDKRDFVKEARGYSRTTEVRFYMAMDQALSGEVQEAVRNLQWVKDNGDRTFYEYPVALSQLASLQESRNHQK